MFIFANFVQKVNIQRSQFEKVNVSLSEFLRFILGSLLELGKSCLKIPKAPLDEYFYHWNILFYFFCTKNRLWPISVSECGRGTCLDFFSYWWISFYSMTCLQKYEIWLFFEYFESLKSFDLNIELEAIYLNILCKTDTRKFCNKTKHQHTMG